MTNWWWWWIHRICIWTNVYFSTVSNNFNHGPCSWLEAPVETLKCRVVSMAHEGKVEHGSAIIKRKRCSKNATCALLRRRHSSTLRSSNYRLRVEKAATLSTMASWPFPVEATRSAECKWREPNQIWNIIYNFQNCSHPHQENISKLINNRKRETSLVLLLPLVLLYFSVIATHSTYVNLVL